MVGHSNRSLATVIVTVIGVLSISSGVDVDRRYGGSGCSDLMLQPEMSSDNRGDREQDAEQQAREPPHEQAPGPQPNHGGRRDQLAFSRLTGSALTVTTCPPLVTACPICYDGDSKDTVVGERLSCVADPYRKVDACSRISQQRARLRGRHRASCKTLQNETSRSK